MTPDLIRALSISGSILIIVVFLIIIISFVTVRRGETSMAAKSNPHGRAHY